MKRNDKNLHYEGLN
ncbi:TPA: hypothetical protein M5J93_001646 [Escherichia coli]|nr:hypothetical protein [Escherichia coli]